MKITVFTITDCYFCKQEKDYLKSHNLPYEERNLEENRDFLTEMLTISNNFAGTPVTKIEKDDGSIVVLKGFTREEFDETLGLKTDESIKIPAQPTVSVPAPVVAPQEPVVQAPVIDVVATPPAQETQVVNPVVQTPTPVAAAPDVASIAAQIEQLKKMQESLMQSSQATAPAAPVPSVQLPAVAPQETVVQAPVVAAPLQPIPAAAPAQNAVDDSLAAILAELQTKINSANSGGTQGQPTG